MPVLSRFTELDAMPNLDKLAEQINAIFEREATAFRAVVSDRLEAGRLLLQARDRLGEGFRQWCDQNIKRKWRDCRKVIRLASAPDPAAAIEAERKPSREKMAANRQAARSNVRPDWPATDFSGGLVKSAKRVVFRAHPLVKALRLAVHPDTPDNERLAALRQIHKLDSHGTFIDRINPDNPAEHNTADEWRGRLRKAYDRIEEQEREITRLRRENDRLRARLATPKKRPGKPARPDSTVH